MTLHIQHLRCIVLLSLALLVSFPSWCFAGDAATWLVYDEDEALHESSSFAYQGVRFSLPDDAVRTPLAALSFFYSTLLDFCPVTIHITFYDHSTEITPPIEFQAANGWNTLDVAALGISVPHNFYVILENSSCGSLMLDEGWSERSFKGRHLESLTTRLSHNLLLRAAIGPPLDVPVQEKWTLSVREKMTVRIKGIGTWESTDEVGETWTLYADGSFGMDNGLFGSWEKKKKQYRFSVDPEDVREFMEDGVSDLIASEVSEIIVTKISFSGKIKGSGSVEGKWKCFTKTTLDDSSGQANLEKKFTAVPAADEIAASHSSSQ